MTLLYRSPRFLEHDTGQHPECAERLRAVTQHFDQQGLTEKVELAEWKPAGDEQLGAVHDLDYVRQVHRAAGGGGGRIEADTVVSPASYDVALLAAGAACDAVRHVTGGEHRLALTLVRPPGHHALPDRAMGFCLFNNVAVAARYAIGRLQLDRVLIVDWDVHHGNGTQDIFWEDPQVAFFSIHRWPFYPGTGAADETGAGRGAGLIRNLPTEFGTPRDRYRATFARELEQMAKKFKPQLVLISAGFDSHREDPIGSLGLETEDFASLTDIVLDVAADHAEGRVVSVLEGGYNPRRLAESLALHLQRMLARSSE